MDYIVDIVLLALFAVMIITGAKNGFVKTVLGVVALAVAVFLAFQLSSMLAPAVYKTFLDQKVYDIIKERITGKSSSSSAQQAKAVMAVIPKSVSALASYIGINTAGITGIIKDLDIHRSAAARELADKVAAPVLTAIVRAVLFSVSFFVLYAVLKLIVALIDRFFKLPVLKSANKLLGGVLGSIKGAAAVFVLCILLQIISGLCTDSRFAGSVDSSKLVGFVANSDFILQYFHI